MPSEDIYTLGRTKSKHSVRFNCKTSNYSAFRRAYRYYFIETLRRQYLLIVSVTLQNQKKILPTHCFHALLYRIIIAHRS